MWIFGNNFEKQNDKNFVEETFVLIDGELVKQEEGEEDENDSERND